MESLQNLDYPSEKEDWLIDVLIGGLISMIPIFNFVAMGYMMDAMEMGMKNVDQLPSWDNMGDKFIRGFWFFIITLVYIVIPVVILTAFLLPMIIEAVIKGDVSTLSVASAAVGGLIYIILLVLASFMIPMALARWVYSCRLEEALRLPSVLADIRKVAGDYTAACLFFFILGGLLFTLVSWIPVINLMVYFYWSVAFYNYFGKLYGRSMTKPALG